MSIEIRKRGFAARRSGMIGVTNLRPKATGTETRSKPNASCVSLRKRATASLSLSITA